MGSVRALLAVVGLLFAGAAHAHGGFPWAKNVVFPSADAADPVIVTTFGLLAKDEAGAWGWVCEEVVGTLGMTSFAALPDGTWLAGGVDGLYRSEDRCAWARTGAPLDGLFITAVARDTTVPTRVWTTSGSGDLDNALWVSEDGGQTFTANATFGAGAALRGFAQGASGLPLAVSGWRDNAAWLWRSEDGLGWTEIPLNAPENASIYLLRVDGDGDVWLRMPDTDLDRLIRVDTTTATEVLSSETAITAFDAGPGQDAVFYGSQEEGLRGSLDGGTTWGDPDAHPVPNCLVSHGEARYVCGHNWSDGAAVLQTSAASTDPSTWTWTDALWFGDVHGPVSCPAGTQTADICGPLWELVAGASGMDLERPDTGGADTDVVPPDEGCGCASSGADARSWLALGIVWAAAWARRARQQVASGPARR